MIGACVIGAGRRGPTGEVIQKLMEYQTNRALMRRLPVQSDGKICPPAPDSPKK
jgi:hypothetical protein